MRVLLFTLGLLGGLPGALPAQRLQQFRFPTLDSTTADQTRIKPVQPDGGMLAAGGLVGGIVGLFGGAIVGAQFTQEEYCDFCGLVGAVYGGVAGGSALLPLGVHLANKKRGDYGPSLLASLAIGAAGFALAVATEQGEIMLGVPIVQIASSITIERATARRRMAGGRDP